MQVLYVICYDEVQYNWRLTALPTIQGGFQSRKPLPKEWRGLSDETQLLKATGGIQRCVFVHPNGFTGANKTYDGVLKMALQAVAAAAAMD